MIVGDKNLCVIVPPLVLPTTFLGGQEILKTIKSLSVNGICQVVCTHCYVVRLHEYGRISKQH